MTLNDMIVQLQLHMEQAKKHIADLESGTKASAPKCRAELQKIKVLAHQLRKECIVSQKAIPVKHRTKVAPAEPVAGRPAVAEVVAEIPAETIAEPPIKKPRKLNQRSRPALINIEQKVLTSFQFNLYKKVNFVSKK